MLPAFSPVCSKAVAFLIQAAAGVLESKWGGVFGQELSGNINVNNGTFDVQAPDRKGFPHSDQCVCVYVILECTSTHDVSMLHV